MKYLTYTNMGCINLCRNMLLSLASVGVDMSDVHIHCMDAESRGVLSALGYKTFSIMTLGADLQEYQNWSFDPGSNFCKIVSWKWKIISRFYQEHEEFVFVDSDVVFKRNIEEDLRSYGKNICVQCDSPGSLYCTGFMYFKKSPEATKIINACSYNHADDQIIFNRFVSELGIEPLLQLLPSDKYPNGWVFYKTPDYDKSLAYIIHNNHMLGKEAKVDSFVKFGNWFLL